MAMKNTQRGFALLIAVIFMSVMLTLGLTLGSLGYKQQVLASSAIQSQYAFYIADAGLECALYADQRQNLFAYDPDLINAPVPLLVCHGAAPYSASSISHTGTRWVTFNRINYNDSTRCADVTVYKYSAAEGGATYIFSQGYDVSCATVSSPDGERFVSRGISARY